MKARVWPACIVTYGCESWTLRKNEETRLEAPLSRFSASVSFLSTNLALYKFLFVFVFAFEMKGLRKILRVSWTAKKTNE